MAKKKTDLTIEDMFSRIDEIVETINNGGLTLDDSIKLYKEGMELASKCSSVLGDKEKEVLLIQSSLDGSFTTKKFNRIDNDTEKGELN